MALWVIRGGAHGEYEDMALEQGIVALGWKEVPDISHCASREDVLALLRKLYPQENPRSLANQASQLWSFVRRMHPRDLVVMPLKNRAVVAIGRVTSEYSYRTDLPDNVHHVRSVQWERQDVPRSTFRQDLLYSFGALQTVFSVERNNAEARVNSVLKTGKDPGPDGENGDNERISDLVQLARDQIVQYIESKFKGHGLARLVGAVLQAQGYKVQISSPGPDGGVDIIAGSGPLGLDSPRLCVQVKSGNDPINVNVLRELQGVISNFGAEHGLLVSWGGFRSSVHQEARRKFFQIRLWNADEFVRNLLSNYEKLPDEIQTELPLTRTWILVPEAEDK